MTETGQRNGTNQAENAGGEEQPRENMLDRQAAVTAASITQEGKVRSQEHDAACWGHACVS